VTISWLPSFAVWVLTFVRAKLPTLENPQKEKTLFEEEFFFGKSEIREIRTSKATKMALKTYGDKPISFQIEENGEFWCVGSEVSCFSS
jgi:hypothetical protein